ncbi:gliding motility-associated C-terminal domain-containing protein, partial [Flavobacteriales bacterium]|nr:gliding motility-associated C-terminal domain-containing protein [Flavobacteriales bacterium]
TTFNSTTGNLCMNPPSPLTSVVAIRVQEYRNGVLIGSIIRDIQVNVLNCTEPPPYLTGIDTLASADSDPTGSISTYNFCTDGISPISFNINALTVSTFTNLTMGWNNSIPNASFNISSNGTSNPQANFSWTPTIADVANSPFFFVVTVYDDACPLMGSFSYSYQINLTNSSGSYVSTDVSCFGLQDGTVDLSVVGGNPPYNFFWWDSVSGFTSNSEDLINLDVGDYYCFIVDSLGDTLGCGVEPIHVSITEPQELIVSSLFSDVSCFGLNDGSIDLSILGGNPAYNVSWTSVNGYMSSLSDISNLSSDIYTATITDANGCGPITETVLITEPPEITLFGTAYDNSCFNAGDGSIDLVTTGNDLIFNWTGPSLFSSNLEDISDLISGIYTVIITDSNSCVGPSASYFVNEPSDIIVTYLTNNVSCFDGNDGSIDLSITGGAGNYNTIWTGINGYFNISEDIFTLSASDYSYSITDANGCSPSVNNSPITITEPSGIQLSSVVTDETCYGDADGSIDMTLTGSSSYTFSWVGPNSFSSSNLDVSSLEAGTYNLQITDLNNCIFLHSETIDIGSIIQVDTFINNISCNGYSDGNIVLVTPNSLSPTFNWTGPNSFSSTSNQILNLESGNYSAIVNDETNCPTQINLSILDPSILSFTSILTDESCEGYQDGQIEIFVSGGTPHYSYVWNNGNTDSINSNLLNGEYILNVVDNNNCIVTDTFTIDLFLFDTTRNITNVSCYGGSDGSADLEILGGNPPFTYNWSPPGSTQDLIAVSSGVYTVNITDFTNCTIVRDVIVTEPQQLSAVTNITNILCYGDTAGSVSTIIGGGVPPYLLDWGSSNISAMWAGYHIFTVTDNNGCKFTDSVNIQQNDSMQITSTITDVQCYGDFNGSLELQIAQGTGTPPYSYLWNGPNNYSSTDEDIYSLESGNYSVIITDANLCNQSLNLFIDQPQQLSQTVTINTSNYSGYNVRCKGENSAWVEISVSGGHPPFSYLWSNGDVSDSIFNLYSGTYSLQITDSLGCMEDLSLNLNEPSTYVSVDVIATSDYNGYNVSCFGVNDGSVFAESINGVPPYTYLWNTNDVKDSLTGLYSGYYEVFVYDKNLCLAIDSVTLNEPSELFFDLFYYPDTCDKSVGKAGFIVNGGVPNYSALWSDSSTTNIVDHFAEGTYSLEVSDANFCNKSESFNIDNLESPIAEFEVYPYHKRLLDQKNEPFYFVDLTNTFWSSVEFWTWSFGDGFFDYDSLVSHTYNDPGTYTVNLEIITFANCIDTISKDVLVDEYSFFIPNTFIPTSSESENRIFKGYGIGVEKYELKIFSRWGELIFETNDLEVGWDGTHQSELDVSGNNDLCPVGVYTYTVFIENIYGEVFEYQGQVKLIR